MEQNEALNGQGAADLHKEQTETPNNQSMEMLLQESSGVELPQSGEIRNGMIASIGANQILVSIGAKSEGVIAGRELESLSPEERAALVVGQEVPVYVINPEDENGNVVLSFKRAQEQLTWENVERMLSEEEVIESNVTGFNKGGLIVAVGGLRGFVPASQISMARRAASVGDTPEQRWSKMVGDPISVRIVEVDRERRRLILSERAANTESRQSIKERVISELEVGRTYTGRVTSLADFGAFVNVNGADGLVHLSEISWEHVQHPSEVLEVGQEIKVKVINIDREKRRIGLSLRQLQEDPWQSKVDKFTVGELVEGVITRLTKFGAFARLEGDLEGLIHISEISDHRIEHPKEVLHDGDIKTLRIIRIDTDQHRIGLSLRKVDSGAFADKDFKLLMDDTGEEESVPAEEEVPLVDEAAPPEDVPVPDEAALPEEAPVPDEAALPEEAPVPDQAAPRRGPVLMKPHPRKSCKPEIYGAYRKVRSFFNFLFNLMHLIVDSHEDLAWNMLGFGRDYTRSAHDTRALEVGSPAVKHNGDTMLGYPEYQRGRVAVVFASLFASPARQLEGNWEQVFYPDGDTRAAQRIYRQQLDVYHRLVDAHPDQFRLVSSRVELGLLLEHWRSPAESHPVGLLLLMEGGDAIREPAELAEWWDPGLRLIGPAWAGTRYCGGTKEPGPLTEDGRTLLKAMADFPFMLDLSHMDEPAALEALDIYEGPVVATHGACLALMPGHPTNRLFSDRVLRGLIERDGVIGLAPYNAFLKSGWLRASGSLREEVSLDRFVDHIDHVCQLAGNVRHAGIGSDFDGGFGLQSVPQELDTIADLQKIAGFLQPRGYSDSDLEAILGGNWLRTLQENLP